MQAEVISIGDELLIGQTINTNAAWIGKELSQVGIPVKSCSTISDDEASIIETIDIALKRSDIVIVTGGLGPTKDDITKHVLCKYFETHLEINDTVLERITGYFAARGKQMLDVNIQQAALPANCTILDNLQGTASGMWFDKNGAVLISMPGVPYEMKNIMKNEVIPRLKNIFNVSSIFHKTILLQGIGESYLADEMQDWEKRIKLEGFGLAYLPSVGAVKLRITSPNGIEDDSKIENYFKELSEKLPKHVYGRGDESLSEVVGKLLIQGKKTVGTVESCTGGALATTFVSIPGSSAYYQGSLLTYSNELKHNLAGVIPSDLEKYGAVSEQIVSQLAENGRKKLGVDYCISTSGIAGPDGGSDDKPVGTVWIGIASSDGVYTCKFNFGDNRERNIQLTVLTALNLLRCTLLGISVKN